MLTAQEKCLILSSSLFIQAKIAISKVILENKYEYTVSNDFVDMHKAEININDLSFDGQNSKLCYRN